MITVRMMTPADYDAVAAMAADAGSRALVGLPFWETREDVAATISQLRQVEFLVAEDENGQVVGMAGYDLKTDGEARLYGPLVATEGVGVGAFLASRIEGLAREKGASAYSMLVGLNNRGGAAWAEWHGYHLDTETPELVFAFLYPGQLKVEPVHSNALVRPATPADLDAIMELQDACFPAVQISRQVLGSWLPEVNVVEHEGKVAGYVRLEEPTGFLHHLSIDPALRRHGLGARLMTQTVLRYWERKTARVGLTVRLDNTAAVALFRRLGFVREVPVAKWLKREG